MVSIPFFKSRSPGRRRKEPERETEIYPRLMQTMGGQVVGRKIPTYKPTPRNLRAFANTPFARRAINAIKNPIAQLEWEVVPKKGITLNPELQRQCETITYCLNNPNSGDTFRSMVERVIGDVLSGAGAIEVQTGGDPLRPLWLFPVDGLSIQVYPKWNGETNEPRYAQVPGYGLASTIGGEVINLRDEELIYIAPNPSTSTPFGVGPLEVAFQSIARMIGVSDFAGNVASNARPNVLLYFKGADKNAIDTLRGWWTNDIEGQGQIPLLGGMQDITAVKLTAEGDAALFLKYQEMLKSEIATAFDLSPQNLGVERDVNRSTAEVAEDRDWRHAIKPVATLLSSHLNRDVIERRCGFSQIEFRWIGLDRTDELARAQIHKIYYGLNALTPNEIREEISKPPSLCEWADMVSADVEIATQAARGSAEVIDDELREENPSETAKTPKS